MLSPVDSSRPAPSATTPACAGRSEIFTDDLLETPPTTNAPVAQRRRFETLTARAGAICVDCPLMVSCLYRAVVDYDVSGFVAGTTEKQRLEIRRRVGVVVEAEDFDTLAGVTGGHRQIDHDEVVRLRRANPQESLDRLAQRLGCSLSTVKRHLRKERNAPAATAPTKVRPTMRAVVDATAAVVNADRSRSRAA